MARLPTEVMADIHILRQDYARALAAYDASPGVDTGEALTDQFQRRARAIRMIHAEDNPGIRDLAAMFRCSKTIVREALAADTTTEGLTP